MEAYFCGRRGNMQAQSKVFVCGKVMVLGALYDAVEKLKWKLLSSNSDTGILMIEERRDGMLFLVRVCPKEHEIVKITVELASGVFPGKDSPAEAAACLLEMLKQIIEDALAKDGKEM